MQPSNNIVEKNAFWLTLLLTAIIGGAALGGYLLMQKAYIFTDIGSDTVNSKYPAMLHNQHYGQTESKPIRWSFQQGMGQNLYNGSPRIPNPIDVFKAVLPIQNVAFRIAWLEWFKFLITAAFIFGYMRLLKLSRITAMLGALCFAFSGYMVVGGSWYGHSTNVMLFSALLFSTELLLQNKTVLAFPIAVAWLGFNPRLYFFSLFLLLYVPYRLLQKGTGWKQAGGMLLQFAGFGLLGLALAAPGTASKYLKIMDSPRMGGSVSKAPDLLSHSLFGLAEASHYITALLRSYSSDILGTGSDFSGWRNYLEAPLFYCGLPVLLLLPQAFIFANRKQRLLFGAAALFWLLIIVFPFFRYAFYRFAGDYYKTALSLFIPLSMLCGAMFAYDKIIAKTRKVNPIGLLLTFAALMILLHFPYKSVTVQSNVKILASAFLMAYTLILFTLSRNLPQQKYAVLCLTIPLFMAFEAGFLSSISTKNRDAISAEQLTQKAGYNDHTLDAVRYLKSIDNGFFRLDKDYVSSLALYRGLNDAKAQGYFGTSTYASFNQGNYIRFLQQTGAASKTDESKTRWAEGLAKRPLLQVLTSVKYNLSKSPQPFYSAYGYADQIAEFGDVKVLRNKYRLPLGFTYNKFIRPDDFKKINDIKKGVALFRAFVPETPLNPNFKELGELSLSSIPGGYDTRDGYGHAELQVDIYESGRDTLTITRFGQNHIKGNIIAKQKSLLFFSIPYDPGWRVRVDGETKPTELVNFGFTGVLLDAGQHEVELTFVPPYSGIERLIFALGVLAWLSLAAFRHRDWFMERLSRNKNTKS